MNGIRFAHVFQDFYFLATKDSIFLLNDFNTKNLMCNIDLIRAYQIRDDGYMLGLTSTGYLIAFELHNPQIKIIWKRKKLSDFVVINHEDGNINLLFYTQDSSIMLVAYPKLTIIYEKKVSMKFNMVKSGLLKECFYFERKPGINGLTGMFLLKKLTESTPQYLLKKLLKQKRYSDAEAIAKKYKLDTEKIYKEKVLHYLSFLNQKLDIKEANERQVELVKILDLIDDVNFVIECCFQAQFPYYDPIYKTLKYAQIRLKENDAFGYQKLMDRIMRLETYNVIYHHPNSTMNFLTGWLEFSGSNIVQMIKKYLENEEFDIASLIFLRFKNIILLDHPVEWLDNPQILLNAIPNATPDLILPWLKLFLATVLQYNSNSMLSIIQFVVEKIKLLEDESDLWPDNGLNLAEAVLEIINESFNTPQSGNIVCINANDNLQKLYSLIQYLKELKLLQKDYSVDLKLQFYMSEKKETIVSSILDKVLPDKIDYLLNEYLEQYLLNNDLKVDEVIQNYLNEITSDFSTWWVGSEAPWESRAIILIKRIYSLNIKLSCILKALEQAPVPWSRSIEDLAKSVLTENHPTVDLIQKQISLVDIKLLLKKYNFQTKKIEGKLQVMQFIQRIIYIEPENFLPDIEKVLKYYPTQIESTQSIISLHFIKNLKYPQLSEYFDYLSDSEALIQIEKLMGMFEHTLSNKSKLLTNLQRALPTLSYKLEKLEQTFNVNKLKKLNQIYQLQFNYNIKIKPEDHSNSQSCENILKTIISEKADKELMEIIFLLNIKPEKGLLIIFDEINLPSKLTLSQYCLNLEDYDPKILSAIALKLLFIPNATKTKDIIETTNLANQFASMAVRKQPDIDTFQLARWTSLFYDLCQPSSTDRISFMNLYTDAPIGCNVTLAFHTILKFLSVVLELASHYPKELSIQIFYENSITRTDSELEMNFKQLANCLLALRNYQYDFISFKTVLLFSDFICHLDYKILSIKLQEYVKKSRKWLSICKQSLLFRRIATKPKIDTAFAISMFHGIANDDINKFFNQYLKM